MKTDRTTEALVALVLAATVATWLGGRRLLDRATVRAAAPAAPAAPAVAAAETEASGPRAEEPAPAAEPAAAAASPVEVHDEPAVPERAPAALRVEGRVLGSDGTPAEGARVAVQPGDDPSTRTDATGRFALEGLAAGEVTLVATRPGELASEPRRIALGSGDAPADVTLRLRPAAVLLGEVFSRDRSPAGGAVVRLRSEDGGEQRTTTTDASGAFRVAGLAAGTWHVETDRVGPRAGDAEPPQSPEVDARTVTLTAGGETRVVLGLPRAAPVRVRGRVHAGERSVEALLTWQPLSMRGAEGVHEAHSEAETGSYAVVLDRPGPHVVTVVPSGSSELSMGAAELVVDVPAESVARLDLALPTGRVVGVARDAEGAPVEDAVLELVPLGPVPRITRAPDLPRQTLSDADGAFAFPSVAPGTYAVRATRREDAESLSPEEDAVLARATSEPTVLGSGADDTVEVALTLPDPADAGVVRVLLDGEPAFGATVLVRDHDRPDVPALPIGTSGRSGEVHVGGLVPAGEEGTLATRFTVLARTPDAASREVPLALGDGPLDLPLLPAIVLRVEGRDAGGLPVPIALLVRDADGLPVLGALDPLDQRDPEAPADPSVHAVGPLLPGSYHLEARGPDGRTATAEVELAPGDAPELVVRLVL